MAGSGRDLLRAWRTREGLTINAAATRVGAGWKEYREWETGPGRPGIDAAKRIADACGIPMEAWANVGKAA
jgi:transcriptional regulator with XRE-family HTH domain